MLEKLFGFIVSIVVLILCAVCGVVGFVFYWIKKIVRYLNS